MKKLSLTVSALLLAAAALSFASCKTPTTTPSNDNEKTEENKEENKQEENKEEEKQEEVTFKIEGANDASTYTKEGNVITLAAEGEPEYILTGTFEGKIIVKAKGTVLKLNGVTLTNKDAPVIDAELKVEIKAEENTENTITTTGDYNKDNKIGAINGAKKVEIGGSGKLTVSGSVCHGIKADDMEVKGSGTYTVSGSAKGSAINCNNFTVKADKTFTLNLKNSKNGIKADGSIDIASGTFNLSDLTTGFKTDTYEDDGESHTIKIADTATVTYKNVTTEKTEDSLAPAASDTSE